LLIDCILQALSVRGKPTSNTESDVRNARVVQCASEMMCSEYWTQGRTGTIWQHGFHDETTDYCDIGDVSWFNNYSNYTARRQSKALSFTAVMSFLVGLLGPLISQTTDRQQDITGWLL